MPFGGRSAPPTDHAAGGVPKAGALGPASRAPSGPDGGPAAVRACHRTPTPERPNHRVSEKSDPRRPCPGPAHPPAQEHRDRADGGPGVARSGGRAAPPVDAPGDALGPVRAARGRGTPGAECPPREACGRRGSQSCPAPAQCARLGTCGPDLAGRGFHSSRCGFDPSRDGRDPARWRATPGGSEAGRRGGGEGLPWPGGRTADSGARAVRVCARVRGRGRRGPTAGLPRRARAAAATRRRPRAPRGLPRRGPQGGPAPTAGAHGLGASQRRGRRRRAGAHGPCRGGIADHALDMVRRGRGGPALPPPPAREGQVRGRRRGVRVRPARRELSPWTALDGPGSRRDGGPRSGSRRPAVDRPGRAAPIPRPCLRRARTTSWGVRPPFGGPRPMPGQVYQWGGELISNKSGPNGLRSAARNNKATRQRTRPLGATQSSAKDLSLRKVKLQSAGWATRFPRGARRRPAKVRGRGLFVSDYVVQGRITSFWHGF